MSTANQNPTQPLPVEIFAGQAWVLPVLLTDPELEFDWTNAEAYLDLTDRDGSVFRDCRAQGDLLVTFPSKGQCLVTITMPGSATASFVGPLWGSLMVKHSAGLWGPYPFVTVRLTVKKALTAAS